MSFIFSALTRFFFVLEHSFVHRCTRSMYWFWSNLWDCMEKGNMEWNG